VRVGTPAFMSPEQLQSRPGITAASDIFSLGIVLAYAATGLVPERDGEGRVLWASAALRALPEELVPLIHSCVRTDPGDRAQLRGLLAMVLKAKRGRYEAAEPSFWPQPMAGRVASAADAIRRDLPSTVARNLMSGANGTGGDQDQAAHEQAAQAGGGRTKVLPGDAAHDDGRQPWARTKRLPVPMDDSMFHAYRPSASAATMIRRPGDPLDAAAYLVNAESLWKNHYFVEAEDAYRASFELDRTKAWAHVDLGCLLWDQRRYRDANIAFRDALNCAPDLIAARRNLYIATKHGGGDERLSHFLKDELRRYCNAVLSTEASTAASYANRGDALCCLERDDDALAAYQMALSYDEGNPVLLRKLAYVTGRLGGT
jgi:tetratricopeptide (TPR) repeat protein